MAHFALLSSDKVVVNVHVVNNEDINHLDFPESEPVGIAYLEQVHGKGGDWKQTSYNNNFRKNYACIGYSYNLTLDAFVPPQPFQSWLLNENTCKWEPPIPMPEDDKLYVWDEETLSWKEIP